MLTQEDRQRIEEEERKRIAEEQYRAEIRSRLNGDSRTPAKQFSRLPWILAIGAVLIAATMFWSNRGVLGKDGEPYPGTRYLAQSQKIATGQIIVKANGYVEYRVTISPEMMEPTVTGKFNASGGTGNDIQAVIADETNFTNWINGHQARIFWGTQGRETTGTFKVRLTPGLYYIVFSNKFSAFTDKQVFLNVDLNYKMATR